MHTNCIAPRALGSNCIQYAPRLRSPAQAVAQCSPRNTQLSCRHHVATLFITAARPARRPACRMRVVSQQLRVRRDCLSVAAAATTPAADLPARNEDTTVVVVGPTGYIGRFVTKELIRRGYKVVAFSRERSGVGGKKSKEDVISDFQGAHKVVFGDVQDMESLRNTAFADKVDVVVSCLASRTGGVKDSWDVDYQATLNCLEVARERGAKQFVLLSAICVQRPLLEFQRAKLAFEAKLQACGDITYSIVRPTAFFKSLAGQVESCKAGGPYVMFGDGQLASCKPISEEDLASYMAECIRDRALWDRVLPIGGPGEALSALQQGEMLFEILGKTPFFIQVPVALFDAIIGMLDFVANLLGTDKAKDVAEFGRIGKYYAVESMLVLDDKAGRYDADATPSYGKDTLRSFFQRVVKEGMAGQELGDAAVFGQK